MQQQHSLNDYKRQAKTLRNALGTDQITHAQALDLVAKQHGFRNWNTLHASHATAPPQRTDASRNLSLGQPLKGHYLGHAFTGTLKSVQSLGETGHKRLTIRFDAPIDVVAFDSFSSFRQQVSCTIGPDGRSALKTSDGQPHMVLTL